MPPKTKSKSQQNITNTKKAKSKPRPKTVPLDGRENSPGLSQRKFDPLTAFSLSSSTPPSTSRSTASSQNPISASQGSSSRSKASITASVSTIIEDSLWVDRYEPSNEAELAVHVKKVDNVRQWLREAVDGGPSGALKKYRRILILTGPAGTGKTSTLRVLTREMGVEILEWKSASNDVPGSLFAAASQDADGSNTHDQDIPNEGLFTKFEAFLTRSLTCSNLFTSASSNGNLKLPQVMKNRLVLLEDLPNIFHARTQERFHEALLSFVNTPPSNPPVPLVIILSDTGLRGEDRDAQIAEGRFSGTRSQVLDIRTVIPRDLLSSAYVTEISFNPIAPTLLRKALQAMLTKHFAQDTSDAALNPSKEVLDAIVETSNGDIRSAIMALQFACIVEVPNKKKKAAKKMVMEAVTRREQTLAMFHLLGKVLYNKRKGDPPNASATAKDLQKEREIDSLLKDPNKLPVHLANHERRASRVDVDMLYSDSPIDSSLFSLYIHQNYSQFCDDVDHCYDVSDWLSWVDSSGGEAWYQANPHQFHLLALGTLHSLPSPVQRRSQKYYKPEFFSCLQKEKEGLEGVRRTRDWLLDSAISSDDSCWRVGGWSQSDVILQLGAVLKAYDAQGDSTSAKKAPPSHKRFSQLEFQHADSNRQLRQLDEHDAPEPSQSVVEDGIAADPYLLRKLEPDQNTGGWLDSDDIQDFD